MNRALGFAVAAIAALASACASYGPPPPRRGPESKPVSSTWSSPIGRQHPLAGQIWSVKDARFVHRDDLVTALTASRMVLLGEQHENADHHRLQASLVRALADAGRHPAIAFEMFDADEQAKIDAAPRTSDAIASAVEWQKKGWPSWAMYAPIADVALERGLAIVAANLPLREARAIARNGVSAIDAHEAEALGLAIAMPPDLASSLRDELVASHCGHLHGEAVERMAIAQRARDEEMATRMLLASRGDGAVLVAGAGHVRRDRGVPFAIARRDPTVTIASVGFVEVEHGKLTPAEYAEGWHAATLPFDYVIFTPRASDEDMCAAMMRPRR